MPTAEERMKILKMIEQGKISADDGARLLAALDKSRDGKRGSSGGGSSDGFGGSARYFRVRVTDTVTGQQKVAVNIPIGLVNFGLRFVPESAHDKVQAVRDAVESGMTGRIVDVTEADEGHRVEIFLE